jgi:hypothetical protein
MVENMLEYSIQSYDDINKSFIVNYNDFHITIKYPKDIDLFSDFLQEDLNLYISGIILNYNVVNNQEEL